MNSTMLPFNWTLQSPSNSPPARDAASLVFNPSIGQSILFGGIVSGVEQNDTWAYDSLEDEWSQLAPQTPPPTRSGASMIFYPTTGQIILFGGSNNGTPLNDTWAFDSVTLNWTQLTPVLSPTARFAASMAFDQSSGQIILFGGSNGTILNDTWAYALGTWAQIIVTQPPPIRESACMSFDPSSGNIILFGGDNDSITLNDTWAFETQLNPVRWTKLNPTTVPAGRSGASMIFDQSNGLTTLFGGINSFGFLDDTWIFDGSDWAQLAASTSPTARSSTTMEFDPSSGQIILFGGLSAAGALQDTWLYGPPSDSALFWENITSGTEPPMRFGAIMNFFPPTGQIILFGGDNMPSGTPYSDTWSYEAVNNIWTNVSPTTSPPGLYGAASVFDPTVGQIVMFAGLNSGGYLNTTWGYAFDNVLTNSYQWTNLTPTNSPIARNAPSLAFDPSTGNVIMFGGYNNGDLADTWAYNSVANTWTQLLPANSPPARDSALMCFSPAIGQIILFGGYNNSGNLSDTWAYDGPTNTWTNMDPAVFPSNRYGNTFELDPSTGQLILFGGGYYNGSTTTNFFNDTWSYDAANNIWTQLTSANNPGGREFANASFDQSTGQMILFGGVNNFNNPPAYNDTWALALGLPASITSANSATFAPHASFSFTVTTAGYPTPTLGYTGTLPTGVTFVDNGNGTGTLSGMTTQTGTFPIIFSATNGISQPATQNFTLIIDAAPQFTSANNAAYDIETGFHFTVTTTGYPIPGINESGPLPNGVTFNYIGSGTGSLAGSATQSGTFPIIFTANNGNTVSQDFTLTINEAPAITSANNATYDINTFFNFNVTTTGYPTPTIVEFGTLPTGVSFIDNGNGTGSLFGTATQSGAFPIMFTASNGVAQDASQNFALIIDAPPQFTSADSATFVINIPFNFTVTTTGYPIAGIDENTILPTGVIFIDNGDGTGTLSGTANEFGTFPLNFSASNGVSPDASQDFTLIIDSAPQFTSAPDFTSRINSPFNFTITTIGDPIPTISYTGTLPTGITFVNNGDGTGTLSGTATQLGPFPIIFTASNGVFPDASQNFSLNIVVSPTITSVDNATYDVNTAFNFTVTTAGYYISVITESGPLYLMELLL